MDVFDEIIQQKEKEIREKFEELQKGTTIEGDTRPLYYEIFKAGYLASEQPTGNQYAGYLKEGNATWAKVHPDEPVFILRGQDITAPGIVVEWIRKNLDTVPETKIKEAIHTVLAMRRYDKRRDPT